VRWSREQLNVQLDLPDVHLGRTTVKALRDAVRFHFDHALRPVRPFDQTVGRAREAETGQHQPLLLGAGIEETPAGACEARSEIRCQPTFEGVATVEDAEGVMCLAGETMLGVPEPARAVARLGGVQKAGPVVARGYARRSLTVETSVVETSFVIQRRTEFYAISPTRL
jgi:hypothetical protein